MQGSARRASTGDKLARRPRTSRQLICTIRIVMLSPSFLRALTRPNDPIDHLSVHVNGAESDYSVDERHRSIRLSCPEEPRWSSFHTELLCQSHVARDPLSGLTTDTLVKGPHIQTKAPCGISQAIGAELGLVSECPIV
jgi:hypothetical protein